MRAPDAGLNAGVRRGKAKGAMLGLRSRLRRIGTRVVTVWSTSVDLLGMKRPAVAADGLPLPPAALMRRVAGTADVAWFLEGGRRAVASLLPHARMAAGPVRVLDFGCGCGRVARHWGSVPGVTLVGVDTELLSVLWCRRRLGLGHYHRNGLTARLRFPDASFDFVYALSVFTHLDVPLQVRWLRELARVLKPGGSLALSLHGSESVKTVPADLQRAFERGELVIARSGRPGSNDCNAFHPFERAVELFPPELELTSFTPAGAAGNPHQDLYVLQRRGRFAAGPAAGL